MAIRQPTILTERARMGTLVMPDGSVKQVYLRLYQLTILVTLKAGQYSYQLNDYQVLNDKAVHQLKARYNQDKTGITKVYTYPNGELVPEAAINDAYITLKNMKNEVVRDHEPLQFFKWDNSVFTDKGIIEGGSNIDWTKSTLDYSGQSTIPTDQDGKNVEINVYYWDFYE